MNAKKDRILKFSLLMLTLLAGLSFAVACGDTITSDTTLTSDLNCPGTALNIGAGNVILDCQGYMINFSSGSGIYSNQDFTTIKNCNIVHNGYVGANVYGIYLMGSSSSIQNANITVIGVYAGGGIYLQGNNNIVSFVNCTFASTTTAGAAVYIRSGGNNYISNNILNGGNTDGVYISEYSGDKYNTIINNTIYSGGVYHSPKSGVTINSPYATNNYILQNTFYPGDSGRGVFTSSNNNLIKDNRILATYSPNFAVTGVLIYHASNNTMINNTVIDSFGRIALGFHLESSINNVLINNTFYSIVPDANKFAFYSLGNSYNNSVTNFNMQTANVSFDGKDISLYPLNSSLPADKNELYNISKYLAISSNSADSWILLNVSYDQADIPSRINKDSLRIYKHNGADWIPANASSLDGVDTVNNVVYANITITSFSKFAVMGTYSAAPTPDITAPTTSFSVSGAPSADGVYTNNVTVNFNSWDDANPADGDSGTKFIYYKYTLIDLNGNVVANSPTYTGPQGTYSWDVPFTCTCGTCNAENNICTLPCCTYNLEYWAIDNENNLESPHPTGILKIDPRSAVETVVPSQPTTVANGAGTASVTIPADAYSQPLDFIMEPSEQSFAPMGSGMKAVAQPLDLGPQCYLIESETDCQSTSGCEFNYETGNCQSVRLNSAATITMPGDCSPGSPYGELVTQVIAKFDGISWTPLTTCTDYNDIGGGRLSCSEEDGRTTIWDTGACTITAQTWSFSPFIVTGYSMQYCSTQFVSQEGVWVVNYDATDTYGNSASGASQQIKVDLYPPSSYAQLTGVMAGTSGWFTSDVVVDFVAFDSMSGVKAVYYSLDNETWNEWAGPGTLSLSESSKLYFYAKDRAGHTSDVQSIDVYIEKTAPTITIEESGTSGAAPWWVSALGLTINATDTESGVKQVCYTIGGIEDCVEVQ